MIRADERTWTNQWSTALRWGFAVALLHRLLMMIWMPFAWLVGGSGLNITFHDSAGPIPPLTTDIEKLLFGVWRRWDTIHYFNLATHGYRVSDPGPTVFGILTPLTFQVSDRLLPGGIDLAAMVPVTLAFALALTFLFRIVVAYYDDSALARWAVVMMALLPLSYYFSAPMSESIYLVMILGAFYFAVQKQWLATGVAGALATLARSQGVLMVGVTGLLLLQNYPLRDLPRRLPALLRQGWPLGLILVAFFSFELWRQSLGLPPLNETYRSYSYIYVSNPIDGLLTNLTWIVRHPTEALLNVDSWALVITFILAAAMLRDPLHHRLPLVAYTFGFALLFASKINYLWGTTTITNTQSYARYALTLFPLTIFAADRLRQLGKWPRLLCIALLILSVLFFSALHALGIGPA